MGSITLWNTGLLLAALTVVMGLVGVAGSTRMSSRWLSCGLFLQGLILLFIAGAAYFRGSIDLRICGVAVTSLLIIQNLLGPMNSDNEQPEEASPSA